jgi:hypothetical protein
MSALKNLAPILQGYDFDVDLLGIKTKSSLTKDYILTSRQASTSIMSFNKLLIPFEMNVIMGLEGSEIVLTSKDAIENKQQTGNDQISFYYPFLSGKRLFRLLVRSVLRKLKSTT